MMAATIARLWCFFPIPLLADADGTIPVALTLLKQGDENNDRVFYLTFGSFAAQLTENSVNINMVYADGAKADVEVGDELSITRAHHLGAPGGGVALSVAFTHSTDGSLNVTYAKGVVVTSGGGEHYDLSFDERVGSIVATISDPHHAITRRRLGWRKYKCHQNMRYAFRIVAVLDRGFYNQCGGTKEAARDKMEEIFNVASIPWEHNFGIKLTMSELVIPGGGVSNTFIDEVPADAVPTTAGDYPCPQRWDLGKRADEVNVWRKQHKGQGAGLWVIFTDCGERQMSGDGTKIQYVGTLGVATFGSMCQEGSVVVGVRWSATVANALTHEVGHAFGAMHTFDPARWRVNDEVAAIGSKAGIMDYGDDQKWDGEEQFHSMHERSVCDIILQSLRIEHSTVFQKSRWESKLFDKDMCWDVAAGKSSWTTCTTHACAPPNIWGKDVFKDDKECADDACDNAQCCKLTCDKWEGECMPAYVRKPDAGNVVCTGGTCSNEICCEQCPAPIAHTCAALFGYHTTCAMDAPIGESAELDHVYWNDAVVQVWVKRNCYLEVFDSGNFEGRSKRLLPGNHTLDSNWGRQISSYKCDCTSDAIYIIIGIVGGVMFLAAAIVFWFLYKKWGGGTAANKQPSSRSRATELQRAQKHKHQKAKRNSKDLRE
eukprot:GEMP01020086.1.p1 GENE.GEMP01020086.1~~GEMP01020086.1.p1  ORF type:complete len:658 (+),score=135.07 GEMP01020086.1:195-2168(+)